MRRELWTGCERGIFVFRSSLETTRLVYFLGDFLDEVFAPSTVIHRHHARGAADFHGAGNSRHQPDILGTHAQPPRQVKFFGDREPVRTERGVVDQRGPVGVEEVGLDERSLGHALAPGRIDHAHRPPTGQMIQQPGRLHSQVDDLDAGQRHGPYGLGHQWAEGVVGSHLVAVRGDQQRQTIVGHSFSFRRVTAGSRP